MVMVFTTGDETRTDSASLNQSGISAPVETTDLTAVPSPEETENTRRCIVTSELKSKSELIRFVLSPDSIATPDLSARLPGRGLWVSADAETLQTAISKNLFKRAAKTNAIVPAGLYELTVELLGKRCLELLGLARGAGAVVTGQPQVEQALKDRKLSYIIIATDAGSDGVKKLGHTAVPLITAFTRDELGAALGRDHLVYIGLRHHALSKKLSTDLARWQGVRTADSTAATTHQNTNG